MKELKRQTSLIAETSPVPTESDELTVDDASDDEGRFVIKASLCCEDRSDLIPDLIKTLKALRLRTLKAEITTLGGRVKNVLFVTGDHGNNNDELGHENDEDHFDGDDNNNDNSNNYNNDQPQYCITSIQEALKAVIEKKIGNQDSSSGSVKRQRTANNNNINIYP